MYEGLLVFVSGKGKHAKKVWITSTWVKNRVQKLCCFRRFDYLLWSLSVKMGTFIGGGWWDRIFLIANKSAVSSSSWQIFCGAFKSPMSSSSTSKSSIVVWEFALTAIFTLWTTPDVWGSFLGHFSWFYDILWLSGSVVGERGSPQYCLNRFSFSGVMICFFCLFSNVFSASKCLDFLFIAAETNCCTWKKTVPRPSSAPAAP